MTIFRARLEVMPGADVETAVSWASGYAEGSGLCIVFDFNGIELEAFPHSSPALIMNYYRQELMKRSGVKQPFGYLHILNKEGCDTNRKLTFTSLNPFGEPGKDYSPEFQYRCIPLTEMKDD